MTATPGDPRHRNHYVAGGVALTVLIAFIAFVLVFGESTASLSEDGSALARLNMPNGGGTVQSVVGTTGPHSTRVPVRVLGDRTIMPVGTVPAGEVIKLDVVVSRPGWVSWLSGSTDHLQLSVTTPAASLDTHYLTTKGSSTAPLRLTFAEPVRVISYGTQGDLTRHVLPSAQSVVSVPRNGIAGTVNVAAAINTWETARSTVVSYFPAGSAAAAVASPTPGSKLSGPGAPITLTFSKPVSQVLTGSQLPPVSPAGAGSWKHLNAHTLKFVPSGYGYGLGAKVHVGLPNGIKLVGASRNPTWDVPGGSTMRLQQMLAQLKYLPFDLQGNGAQVPSNLIAQERAAINVPSGSFSFAYPNEPSQLKAMWSAGTFGTMTKGALMAFQNDHGLTADGSPGPLVWRALIDAVDKHQASSFGYTSVTVHKNSSPQSVSVWHNGRTVVGGAPVNTGIASAPTASGTFPVFEHVPVTTMSGNNPDGSHYSDPGIQFVSYFNGGDALHAFTRSQFGFPQSLGCVEMQLADAARVYRYTPIGTLVTVA